MVSHDEPPDRLPPQPHVPAPVDGTRTPNDLMQADDAETQPAPDPRSYVDLAIEGNLVTAGNPLLTGPTMSLRTRRPSSALSTSEHGGDGGQPGGIAGLDTPSECRIQRLIRWRSAADRRLGEGFWAGGSCGPSRKEKPFEPLLDWDFRLWTRGRRA